MNGRPPTIGGGANRSKCSHRAENSCCTCASISAGPQQKTVPRGSAPSSNAPPRPMRTSTRPTGSSSRNGIAAIDRPTLTSRQSSPLRAAARTIGRIGVIPTAASHNASRATPGGALPPHRSTAES
ncbi:hypothetical protein BBK82_43545 [Lentzea guizhouensis]|uniref:Uncharacterized protein n=1 Tax=Lentzea guizhouensis TaxID=1586287 RepID=A0A1B2HVS2_9PSEU|nr:hypothetical protein BBK82_43545 [Lentzea guizhouensis]